MKRDFLKIFGFFLLIFPILFCAGCLDNGDEPDTRQTVSVTLKNGSNEEIHLWTKREEMGSANKVQPGSSRTTSEEYLYNSLLRFEPWKITVYAGKNGNVLHSGTFQISSEDVKTLIVKYTGSSLVNE